MDGQKALEMMDLNHRDFNKKAKVVVGVGVPLELRKPDVLVGWSIRAGYHLPTNISQSTGSNSRKRRSFSRWQFYEFLEKEAERRGHGGKACILRLICQESDTPFDTSNGLFEEFFHVLLT
ncbi:hypothetical protein NQ317_016769 [Molorchus minor]|uniref:Uncharacterized protein n=1 Tax=Molorchus minor TaxID=1323400 RepID=A0ABQ9JNJ2_9CUCU|nr:hypothetical protein NQ317_016769 [Molorchus minor]